MAALPSNRKKPCLKSYEFCSVKLCVANPAGLRALKAPRPARRGDRRQSGVGAAPAGRQGHDATYCSVDSDLTPAGSGPTGTTRRSWPGWWGRGRRRQRRAPRRAGRPGRPHRRSRSCAPSSRCSADRGRSTVRPAPYHCPGRHRVALSAGLRRRDLRRGVTHAAAAQGHDRRRTSVASSRTSTGVPVASSSSPSSTTS